MLTHTARVLRSEQGKVGRLGSMGVRFMVDSADTGGAFSLVEHPIPPHKLAAPLHRHSRQDEYTFVLAGEIGVLLGDEMVFGAPGDLIFKPRGQWHTFWNAGSEPARVLEIISPAGFEGYFEQLSDLLATAGSPPDPKKVGEIADRFGLELDPTSIPRLTAEHGLTFGRDSD
jgi:mannose-6-phosphate isomerase-like protein (cupin superfamily)